MTPNDTEHFSLAVSFGVDSPGATRDLYSWKPHPEAVLYHPFGTNQLPALRSRADFVHNLAETRKLVYSMDIQTYPKMPLVLCG